MQTIARVLSSHGFGHLVTHLRLDGYVPLPKRWKARVGAPPLTEEDSALGRRLVRVCEDLGPTFIKLGQVASTRPDILPADIISELVGLQDHVPPFPTVEAREIIREDLGDPIDQCYATFDEEPFASGSIAQVYRATTRPRDGKPGRRVVVKVKRPDIEDTVRLDMTILRWIAELVERWLPELHNYQPRVIVDEFERTVMREMDFINEASTISRFAEAFADDSTLRIPEVHWELTGPRVLTIEELGGVSAQTLMSNPDPAIDRRALAEQIIKGFMRQYFELGMFHGDPHPGNLLIEPPSRVGLIDFGLTGQFDDAMLGHLVVGLLGAFNKEPEIVVEVLADMGALGEETDRAQLRRQILELVQKYYGLPLKRIGLQSLFYEFTSLLRNNDVTLPRDFVLFGKSLVTVGGICMQIAPEIDLFEMTHPRLRRLFVERFAPSRMIKSATITGWHLLNILRSAPGQIRDISRQLARGRWRVNIHHQNLDYLANELDRASNRLGFSVIIASIIMASSWVLTSESDIEFMGIPLPAFGVAGYLVAGVMGLWLVVAILRSGKLS